MTPKASPVLTAHLSTRSTPVYTQEYCSVETFNTTVLKESVLIVLNKTQAHAQTSLQQRLHCATDTYSTGFQHASTAPTR